jgi:hypothetical protein
MRRILFCLVALGLAASPTASYAQFQVSHPSIRYEEWHYSDYYGGNLTGHFITFCNDTYYSWGHPDVQNFWAEGDCEGY